MASAAPSVPAAEREANHKRPAPVRTITDPDSRPMPVRGGGSIQGYNAQNMTGGDGLIITTELTDAPVDCQWFEPMIGQAEQAASLIEAHRRAGSRLGADYFTRRLDPERETRRLIAKLEALGHTVTLQPAA